MTDYGPATAEDIRYLTANLGEISRAEIEAFGWTAELVRDDLLANPGNSEAWRIDGKAAIINGHDWAPALNVRLVWSLQTDAYWQSGMRGVRYQYAYIQRDRKPWPGVIFECRTCSPHPQVAKWYKILGFEPAGEIRGIARSGQISIARVFRLKPIPPIEGPQDVLRKPRREL